MIYEIMSIKQKKPYRITSFFSSLEYVGVDVLDLTKD